MCCSSAGSRPASSAGTPPRALVALDLTFSIGVYLLAAGYGAHEVTNYLHVRFCEADTSRLCEIIAFNNDEFSHWVFFVGFVLVNGALLLVQAVARTPRPARLDHLLITLNALLVAAAIFANLALEESGLDLPVIAVLVVLSLAIWRWRGPRPLVTYYAIAYGVGLLATVPYVALT